MKGGYVRISSNETWRYEHSEEWMLLVNVFLNLFSCRWKELKMWWRWRRVRHIWTEKRFTFICWKLVVSQKNHSVSHIYFTWTLRNCQTLPMTFLCQSQSSAFSCIEPGQYFVKFTDFDRYISDSFVSLIACFIDHLSLVSQSCTLLPMHTRKAELALRLRQTHLVLLKDVSCLLYNPALVIHNSEQK